jgi:hypothetical protein
MTDRLNRLALAFVIGYTLAAVYQLMVQWQ